MSFKAVVPFQKFTQPVNTTDYNTLFIDGSSFNCWTCKGDGEGKGISLPLWFLTDVKKVFGFERLTFSGCLFISLRHFDVVTGNW